MILEVAFDGQTFRPAGNIMDFFKYYDSPMLAAPFDARAAPAYVKQTRQVTMILLVHKLVDLNGIYYPKMSDNVIPDSLLSENVLTHSYKSYNPVSVLSLSHRYVSRGLPRVGMRHRGKTTQCLSISLGPCTGGTKVTVQGYVKKILVCTHHIISFIHPL